MTALVVEPGWRERVFLFTLALSDEAAMRYVAADLAEAIGAPDIKRTHVQAFPVTDVASLGLVTFLIEGMGVSPRALDGHRAQIDALTGWVLVIDGLAFEERPAPLTIAPPLALVGAYDKLTAETTLAPLRSESARGGPLGTPPAPYGSGANRNAMIAFVFIVLAILTVAGYSGFQ